MISPQDLLGRPIRDLRISVTDQCNFRCAYCMPREQFGPDYAFLPMEKLLSPHEILRVVGAFLELGVQKVRLTGGEPLLRRGFVDLVAAIRSDAPQAELSLTTNGTLLPRYAAGLKAAGIDRINVSLDSLDDASFAAMNGHRAGVGAVLKGIDAAAKAGLPLKVNMVVRRGRNEDEILPMAEHFLERGITLRFIEYMDVGSTNQWRLGEVFSAKEILDTIGAKHALLPVDPNYRGEVAVRYRYRDYDAEIGIISSVTRPFCRDCHRARLSADGKLFTCLFASSGYDLMTFLREGGDDAALLSRIAQIWTGRKDRYSEERAGLIDSGQRREKVEMSYIGG